MYKRLYLIGISAYIAMIIYAILFFRERTMLNDLAYYLFHMVKDGSFAIQSSRFGEGISQLFAVIPRKLNLPIKSILISYSAGFAIINLLAYLLVGFGFRQYRMALVLLLFHVLFATHTFYYTGSQLLLGIVCLFVFFAYINLKEAGTLKNAGVFFVITGSAFLTFFHPLMIFPLCYSLAFFWLHSEVPALKRKSIYYILGSFFSVSIIKSFLIKTPYERHSMSGLKNFATLFPNYFTTYSNKLFLQNCLTHYYWIPVLTIAIFAFYWRNNEWLKLGLFCTTLIGYIFLINISYPSPVTPEFYIENLYIPIGIFLALPFVFDILPELETHKLATASIILILVTGCVRIYNSHAPYTAHITWNRNFIKQYGHQKIIISIAIARAENIPMLWGTPYEFWILSELEQNKTASIIIDKDPQERKWAEFQNKALVVNWNIFSYNQLDPKYFHLTDTVTGYTIIR